MPQKLLSKKIAKLLIILTVCVLLIFFIPKRFFDPLRGVFLRVSYPFQKAFYLSSGKISDFADFLGSISNLKEENKMLIKENDSLSSEVASLRDDKNQNQILREQLGLIPKEKFNLEASFVIGQDSERYEGWILIDKGSSSGIKEGMPVIVSNSILVGKISEVYGSSSRVKLLTDSSSVINAIDTETNAKGIIRGEYGLGIILDLVSQNDIINSGDTVATSGLGGDFPRGLLIGKIQEIKSTEDKLFQQAVITMRSRYSKLDVVFVVKNQ